MGYNTDFDGKFTVSPVLDAFQVDVLKKFSRTRHEDSTGGTPKEAGWPDSYYCDWEPTDDGSAIQWNGAEKFYDYTEWIEFLVRRFIAPSGRVLNGEVRWSGEENGDLGVIRIKNNKVVASRAVITFPEDG